MRKGDAKEVERKRTARNGRGKKRSRMTHRPRSRVGSRQGQSGVKSTDPRTLCWLNALLALDSAVGWLNDGTVLHYSVSRTCADSRENARNRNVTYGPGQRSYRVV